MAANRRGQQRGTAKKPRAQATKKDTRKRPCKKAASQKGVRKAKAIQPRTRQQQAQLGDAIQHSISKDGWPDNLFQLGPDNALRLFADRICASAPATKESPYLDEACEGFLLSMNINPDDHKEDPAEEDPAEEDIAMYNRLFESHDCETPTGSIFDNTTFLYVCNLLRDDSE
ncbi:hypothetical protein BJX65DRAFT_314194 [Aspergillus insuetus]